MNTKETNIETVSRAAGDIHDTLAESSLARAIKLLSSRGSKPDAALVFDIYDTIRQAETLSRQLQTLSTKIQRHLDR